MAVGDKKAAQPTKSRAVKSPVIEGKIENDASGGTPKAPRSRMILPGLIAAMLIGGGLGVAGSYGLAWFDFWPASRTGDQNALAGQEALALRIDGLGEAVSDLDQKPGPDLSGFAKAGQVAVLGEQTDALETAVMARLEALEQAMLERPEVIAPSGQGLGEQDLAPILAQLAALAETVAALPDQNSGTALGESLTATVEQVAALEKARALLAVGQSGQGKDIVKLRGQVAALTVQNTALQTKIAAFEGTVERALTARAVVPQNSGDTVARLSLALALIDTALDRGTSFAAPYALVERSGLAANAISGLGDMVEIAAFGAVAPTMQLGAFKQMAARLVVADDMAQPATVRLVSKLKSSIGMRPVGMAQGADAGAIVARVEAYLTRGDFVAAYGEWQNLPEAGRAKSAAWARGLKDYIDARAMVELVRQAALSSLGGAQ